jgi:hypothetical protein
MRLVWRSPARGRGLRGFADWVRALVDENGVYLVREVGSDEVLYIGESHTGRLYDTLTRHLQNWNGFGSGPSYHPDYVEVAVLVVEDPEDAIALQYELIQEHQPADNQKDGRSIFMRVDAPDEEEVPF